MKIEILAVDAVGYVPESNLEEIGTLTYRDTRTGAVLIQEPAQVVRITAE